MRLLLMTVLAAAAFGAAGQEGPDSNVVAFVSALPLPAPTNLRFQ